VNVRIVRMMERLAHHFITTFSFLPFLPYL